jgi:hypothetical protein
MLEHCFKRLILIEKGAVLMHYCKVEEIKKGKRNGVLYKPYTSYNRVCGMNLSHHGKATKN